MLPDLGFLCRERATTNLPVSLASFYRKLRGKQVAKDRLSRAKSGIQRSGVPGFHSARTDHALPRQPPPRRFALVVGGGFEHRLGEGGVDAQRGGAVVGEAMLAAGRDDDELARGEGDVGVADPDVGGQAAKLQNAFLVTIHDMSGGGRG